MRLANLSGRLVLLEGDTALDVERASNGTFLSDPQAVFDRWPEFVAWAATVDYSTATPFAVGDLGAPAPAPRQIFAIGLNYRDHAEESHLAIPEHPLVFTKFQSSIAGPTATVALPAETVDYEVELVVVIGIGGHGISQADAWGHVAGLSVGQDISERVTQTRGPAPQFSLGKSFPNFSPFGPVIVTLDEVADPDALRIQTDLEGPGADEAVSLQDGNTRDLIFSVPDLIERLSAVVTFYPGDLIFTGTPAGVGQGRDPKVYLRAGQTLVSTIEGIGQLRNPIV